MYMGIFGAFRSSPDFLLGGNMSFFDEYEDRVIMREFLDDADFYEDGDLEDDGLINLSRYDNNVADDLDAGDAPELEGEDR
jgi:hypothetical protein